MTRPASVTRPALALALVAFALFGVARTTGSGWLIVILTGVGSVVGLAFVLPWFGLRRVTIEAEAPRDATVGRTTDLMLDFGGGDRPVKVRPLGFEAEWAGALTPCRGSVPAAPLRRGVMTSIAFDVRSAAPLGLVWWRRTITVELSRPIDVGPRPVPWGEVRLAAGDEAGRDAGRVSSVLADAVRTIREYVAGDPIKLVNWAATARAGELMVKDLESPHAPTLVIAVDLRGGAEEAVEAAASRAAGLALAGLRAGIPVELFTSERLTPKGGGPRRGPVSAPVEVGRRLARAVAGPLPVVPPGLDPITIRASEV